MRIVVVSAHYPPEFVSGGTLVPMRLARGLAARGHEVAVYAGSLDQQRRPLETWQDEDPTGLRVRWIATWPWIGWSDRHNFDNPGVTADFAAWLAEVRPDVVHLHSLQSLGCGLVEAAAAAGAAVVVTMHDFWWICARQFLVDRSYHPCCLVVDCGTCPCEVDRAWLSDRRSRQKAALDLVDLVLVPSAVTAAVLAANGVAPDRIVVDENGLPSPEASLPEAPSHQASPPQAPPLEVAPPVASPPEEPTGPTPPAAGPVAPPDERGPLRLLYAGGPDRMKGADILVAAAAQLAARDGWRLTGYGLDSATVPGDLPIEVKPPYAEGQLSAVLAGADVLVVPSVMRETFSILTREALRAGVPVVTTDTLGPEEIVVDGRNGLIVPAADPGALARAITRLLDDPTLLKRLRESATAVAVRPIEEQVRANETRYRQLLDRAAAAPRPPARAAPPWPSTSRRPTIRHVVFAVGIEGAPLRYRARLPAEGLALLGVSSAVVSYRDPDLRRLLSAADAAVFYRVPAADDVIDMIAETRGRGCPVLFDVDDLIFDPDLAAEIPALSILPPAEAELWLQGVRRYRTTMEACDVFVGSTERLCCHATQVTGMPAERFGNGVGLLLGRLSDQALQSPRPEGPLRIGYFSGTTTHDRDWAEIEPVVLDALDRHRELELWLVGHLKTSPALDRYRDRVRKQGMVPWTDLPGLLRAVDLNLAPLEAGSRFNEAKSAIKWLEAALVATPTVASPTEPFREAIVPGLTGLLAASPDDWAQAIDRLIEDPDLVAGKGVQARRAALLEWSPHLQGQRYLALLERAVARVGQEEGRRPARGWSTGWAPVALQEPPVATPLEPYAIAPQAPEPLPVPAVAPRRLSRQLRSLLRRGFESLRRDGPQATMGRAARLGRRHLKHIRLRNLANRRP